ncbi:MAG: hypothetical protein IH956_05450 [Chloroflexi bacterium]|nr:hypothetical protein [Chloroflexota bacterium]
MKAFDPDFELKYNKHYIGLAKNGQPNNFAIFRPKKNSVRMELRLEQSENVKNSIEEAGLDEMDYDRRWGRYRIRLTKPEIAEHSELLGQLLQSSFERSKS